MYNHLLSRQMKGSFFGVGCSLKKKKKQCTGQFERGSLLHRHNLPVFMEPASAVLREKQQKKEFIFFDVRSDM